MPIQSFVCISEHFVFTSCFAHFYFVVLTHLWLILAVQHEYICGMWHEWHKNFTSRIVCDKVCAHLHLDICRCPANQ